MKLLKSQLVLANHARLTYCVTLAEGADYQDLFRPQTWAHVARDLKKGTLVEVTAHDHSWFAVLYVRSATDLDVTVSEVLRREFDPIETKTAEEYEIKHRGRAKWSVLRTADKAVMVDGLETREAAEEWLKNPLPKAA